MYNSVDANGIPAVPHTAKSTDPNGESTFFGSGSAVAEEIIPAGTRLAHNITTHAPVVRTAGSATIHALTDDDYEILGDFTKLPPEATTTHLDKIAAEIRSEHVLQSWETSCSFAFQLLNLQPGSVTDIAGRGLHNVPLIMGTLFNRFQRFRSIPSAPLDLSRVQGFKVTLITGTDRTKQASQPRYTFAANATLGCVEPSWSKHDERGAGSTAKSADSTSKHSTESSGKAS